MKKNKIVIGSRESKLAVLQSEMVRDYIKKQNPELEVEILTMKTTGDTSLTAPWIKVGGKGHFVKELDKALMDGKAFFLYTALKICQWKYRKSCRFWHFPKEKTREMCWYFRRALQS